MSHFHRCFFFFAYFANKNQLDGFSIKDVLAWNGLRVAMIFLFFNHFYLWIEWKNPVVSSKLSSKLKHIILFDWMLFDCIKTCWKCENRVDGINKYGWCLTGGRGCWLKGPHQIPSVSWIYHHSLHFHIYQIASFAPGILCPLYCYYKWWGDGIGRGWLIYNRVWEEGQGVVIILQVLFLTLFFTCVLSFVLSCPLSHFLSD